MTLAEENAILRAELAEVRGALEELVEVEERRRRAGGCQCSRCAGPTDAVRSSRRKTRVSGPLRVPIDSGSPCARLPIDSVPDRTLADPLSPQPQGQEHDEGEGPWCTGVPFLESVGCQDPDCPLHRPQEGGSPQVNTTISEPPTTIPAGCERQCHNRTGKGNIECVCNPVYGTSTPGRVIPDPVPDPTGQEQAE